PSIAELKYTSGVFGVDDNVIMPEIYVLPCGRIYGQVLHGDEPVTMSVELRGTSIDIIYAAQADENGYFDISRILPDTYMIVFTLDDDYVFGAKTNALIGAYDENRREIECEIGVGQVMQDVKVDAALTGTVNGYIFFDYSGDGDAENVLNTPCDSGVTVDLIRNGAVVSTVTADSTGCFVFEKVIPASDYQVVTSLQDDMRITFPKTDTVSLSVADGEDDLQVNIGIVQYASISGSVWNIGNSMGAVSNIHVYLYNEYVNGPIAECLTDENGAFLFDTLEPGSCYLAADLPDGYLFARKSDTVSHASYIFDDDEPVMIELSMGTAATACDIGIGAPGRIGDYAWLDINGNGLIDIGEPQLPGIRIEMYMGNELVAETYSDEYGYWDFTDMYPGEYTMKVYMPAEVMTTLHRDDFVNVNSILPSGLTGTAGVTVYVPSNERDLACDLGFVCIDENVLPEAVKDLPTIDWSFNGKKQYNFD
ncbi:MAG: hypothetical protein CW338_02895, partial [Clostridiales bacterium]|nr:hypothetical protein [Clostridiales bacterium]